MQAYFTIMREELHLETQAGVLLIESVRLIWGPLKTGFILKVTSAVQRPRLNTLKDQDRVCQRRN